jgi:PAS domain S-box-containing protein
VENLSLELSHGFLEGYSMLEKCPAIVSDFENDSRFSRHQFLLDHGVMSGISVPMVAHDRAMGVLCILYRKPLDIDTAELWYLNVAANTLGVYLQKERSLEKLQRSEAFITSVLEAIGEGVVVVGPDFKILSANMEYLRMSKRVGEDVVGRHCYEVSQNIDSPCYEQGESCPVKKVFETGKSGSSLHTHYLSNGSPIYVQTHAYPVRDSSGKVTAAVETIVDVTDKVRLERDLEKRVRELEEFYDMAVGRELRMIELKEEVESLRAQLEQYRKKA